MAVVKANARLNKGNAFIQEGNELNHSLVVRTKNTEDTQKILRQECQRRPPRAKLKARNIISCMGEGFPDTIAMHRAIPKTVREASISRFPRNDKIGLQ